MYNSFGLFIDGSWTRPQAGGTLSVMNPATGEEIGRVAHAERADLDRALAAAERGFETWRKISAYERAKIMRKAAGLMRERADDIPALVQYFAEPTTEEKKQVNILPGWVEPGDMREIKCLAHRMGVKTIMFQTTGKPLKKFSFVFMPVSA